MEERGDEFFFYFGYFGHGFGQKQLSDRLVNKSESRREGNHTDCRGKKSKKINFKAEKLSFRFVSERIFLITAHVLKRYQH